MNDNPEPKRKRGRPRSLKPLKPCSFDGCEKNGVILGMCQSHYQIALRAEKCINEARGELAPIGANGRRKGGPGSGHHNSGAGRPPLIVGDEATLKRIRDLAGLQCTKYEIAGVLQIDKSTFTQFLDRTPEAVAAYEDGKMNGKASLRRMQFILAKRSAAMGIHLGRQYLDQFDKRPAPADPGFLLTGDPASEEAPSALLRAVKAENE